jgi:hypothetical protein
VYLSNIVCAFVLDSLFLFFIISSDVTCVHLCRIVCVSVQYRVCICAVKIKETPPSIICLGIIQFQITFIFVWKF